MPRRLARGYDRLAATARPGSASADPVGRVEPESGVALWDLLNTEERVPALNAMAPVWTPSVASRYRPIIYGSLLDKVVLRITGNGVAAEIAAPLALVF